MTDFNIKSYLPMLAAAFGESPDGSFETKAHIVSSILNRAESGAPEFGAETGRLSDVLSRGYSAYAQKSPKFMEALDQSFKDKSSEDSFKEYVSILSGMLRGTIKRSDTLFVLKDKEVKKILKTKAMNLDLLEKIDAKDDMTFFKYKPAGKRKNSKTRSYSVK